MGRRRDVAGDPVRGGAWPEMANLGLPGVNPARAWVGWHLRGMRKPMEAKAGLGQAWAGLATARGGLRGGASPARACRGCWVHYRLH